MDRYEFMPSSRTWGYAFIYLVIFLIIFVLGSLAASLPRLAWDVQMTRFIEDRLWWIFGLFLVAVTGILAWNRIDKSVAEVSWKVYFNVLVNKNVFLTYKQGFNIGNIFEREVMVIELFKLTDSTPADKHQTATAKDDTLRIWGTITVEPIHPSFLKLGKDLDARKQAAIRLAWSSVKTYIEEFTSQEKSEDCIGKNVEITQHVASRLPDCPVLKENGLRVTVSLDDVSESLKAQAARSELKASVLMKESIDLLAAKPGPNGYKEGEITHEEAAAIHLAKFEKGVFNRDIRETIIRVKGDPEAFKLLQGTAALAGIINDQLHGKAHDFGTANTSEE